MADSLDDLARALAAFADARDWERFHSPKNLASALIAGAALSYMFCDDVNSPVYVRGPTTRAKPFQYADLGLKAPIIVGLHMLVAFIWFCYMAPLTYGTPG